MTHASDTLPDDIDALRTLIRAERAAHAAVVAERNAISAERDTLAHVFSITATIGIAATGRDAVFADRSGEIERHKRALSAYENAKARKTAMPATRPVSAIRADLATTDAEIAEQARREDAERAGICGTRCAEAVGKGEAAKAARTALKAELATALEAERASADLIAARTALDAIKSPRAADPQAATLAAYIPHRSFTEREAALMLPLLPSLIVEFGGPVCFLIAGAFFSLARDHSHAIAPKTSMLLTQLASREAGAELTKRLPAPALRALRRRRALTPAMSGAEIAALRAALAESQEAFAARFGVNARTIRRWESGERVLSRRAVLQARTLAMGLRSPVLAIAA